MIVKQLITALQKCNQNANVVIKDNMLSLQPKTKKDLAYIDIYKSPSSIRALESLQSNKENVELVFQPYYITILEPYYLYLRWREHENLKQKGKLAKLIETIDNTNIKNKLIACLSEDFPTYSDFLSYKNNEIQLNK